MTASAAWDAEADAAANRLAAVGRRLHGQGWLYGTSGNLSMRLSRRDHVVVTASGRDKGALTPEDFVLVDLSGQVVDAGPGGGRPSAETSLHLAVYRTRPDAGATLHAHTVASTLLVPQAPPRHDERLRGSDAPAGMVDVSGFEMVKGWGFWDPDTEVRLPVFTNHAHVPTLGAELEAWLEAGRGERPPAAVIRRHGLTAWGASVADALRHLEVAEFLCRCVRAERA